MNSHKKEVYMGIILKLVTLCNFSFFSSLIAKDIPIIVIAPSKKPQSISTVGSSVVVLDEKFLKKIMIIS